jgi:hypothetical protein
MELGEGALQRFEPRRARFEQYDDLAFIRDLALPAIQRSRTGKERTTGDQPTLEQGPYELYGLIFGCDGSEYDDSVSVGHDREVLGDRCSVLDTWCNLLVSRRS